MGSPPVRLGWSHERRSAAAGAPRATRVLGPDRCGSRDRGRDLVPVVLFCFFFVGPVAGIAAVLVGRDRRAASCFAAADASETRSRLIRRARAPAGSAASSRQRDRDHVGDDDAEDHQRRRAERRLRAKRTAPARPPSTAAAGRRPSPRRCRRRPRAWSRSRAARRPAGRPPCRGRAPGTRGRRGTCRARSRRRVLCSRSRRAGLRSRTSPRWRRAGRSPPGPRTAPGRCYGRSICANRIASPAIAMPAAGRTRNGRADAIGTMRRPIVKIT